MKRVVLYCRVSTKEQEKGNSLDWQEDYLRRYCELKGYEIVTKPYREDVSGKNFKKRSKFQDLMKFCKANKNNVDSVLCTRWDRYSRDLKEALINLDFFKKLNIEVNSVEQHIDFSTTDYITFLALYIGMAQSENNKIHAGPKKGFMVHWKKVSTLTKPQEVTSTVKLIKTLNM